MESSIRIRLRKLRDLNKSLEQKQVLLIDSDNCEVNLTTDQIRMIQSALHIAYIADSLFLKYNK